MYLYLEKWDSAKLIFKHIINIKPDYNAYSNLGNLYFFHDENYKSAANMFEKALNLNSDNYILWGNLAAAYFQIPGYKDKSFSSYRRAIELGKKDLEVNQNDPVASSFLASYYSMLKNNEMSIQYLQKSLALSSDDIDIKERNIETYETLGKREEALKLTDEILEKGYPVSKLENSPDLKNMLKDKRFENLKRKYLN